MTSTLEIAAKLGKCCRSAFGALSLLWVKERVLWGSLRERSRSQSKERERRGLVQELTKTTHVQKCVRGSPLLPQVLTHRQARTALPAPTSLADGTTLGMGPTGMMGVRPGVLDSGQWTLLVPVVTGPRCSGVAPTPHYPALVLPPLGTVLRVSLAPSRNDTSGCIACWGLLPEVGIDPVKIEIDPSIFDRFEIDSIQIMGLERQIDLTLKWS